MIYFVRETGLLRSRVKIGFTNNIRGRLSGLRGDSLSDLKLLLALPGDTKIETIYHEKFGKYRLHGEWFHFGIELRLFILKNQFNHIPLTSPESGESFLIEDNPLDEPIEEEELPSDPTEGENKAIKEFYKLRGKGNFSWKKATQMAFGNDDNNRTGKNYIDKLKRILDKSGIDYTMYLKEQ